MVTSVRRGLEVSICCSENFLLNKGFWKTCCIAYRLMIQLTLRDGCSEQCSHRAIEHVCTQLPYCVKHSCWFKHQTKLDWFCCQSHVFPLHRRPLAWDCSWWVYHGTQCPRALGRKREWVQLWSRSQMPNPTLLYCQRRTEAGISGWRQWFSFKGSI